jgi:hypothetical protein
MEKELTCVDSAELGKASRIVMPLAAISNFAKPHSRTSSA